MFLKILVAIDGSDVGKNAFDQAVDLAKQNNAEIHSIYVVDSDHASSGAIEMNQDIICQDGINAAQTYVDKLIEEAKEKDVTVISHIRSGHPGNTIIDLAVSLETDLIVIGSRGKSKLDRLILGSVSLHVLNNTNTNILIVKK